MQVQHGVVAIILKKILLKFYSINDYIPTTLEKHFASFNSMHFVIYLF